MAAMLSEEDSFTLHDAESKEVAQLLVESVEPDKQRDLILAVDETQSTALHVAVDEGRVDVVEYLCSMRLTIDELILKKDMFGNTALHCAESKEIVQLLIESVAPDKRPNVILAADENQCTTLHMAAGLGRTEVVEYLCSIPLFNNELILQRDMWGQTALHYAASKEIASILLESVILDKRKEYILAVDENQGTALHLAAAEGSTDVVEYFCNLYQSDDELILKQDKWDKTALHHAANKEIAQLLVESLHPDKQRSLILTADENSFTALHAAAGKGTDVVEYLCGIHLPGDELILKRDKLGLTALHHAENKGVAQLLVESVEFEKRRELLLASNEDGCTALLTAATQGKADVVEYLCSLSEFELIMTKDSLGCTALHYAEKRETAQILLESLAPARRSDFLLTVGEDRCTALHTAAKLGRTDIVKYLCEIPLPNNDLLLKGDKNGGTALHYADTSEIARILMESVASNKQCAFLLDTDDNLRTALHTVVWQGRTEVVEYLCSISPPDDELILKKDKVGRTALHYSEKKEIAQLLVESVRVEKRSDFLLAFDEKQRTALHAAAKYDRTEVAEYLCSIPLPNNELILKKDRIGGTALHHAKKKEIAQILVESVESDVQRDFILAAGENQFTALHIAAALNRTELVEYLCSINMPDDELMVTKNIYGETVLHSVASGELIDIILDSLDSNLIYELLQTEDVHGNTVILSLTRQGRVESLARTLEYIEQDDELEPHLANLLQHTNSYKQNIFHLAALSLAMNELYVTLQDYMPFMDMDSESILSTDAYNNTPLHYVAAKYGTREFTEFILRLSLPKRRDAVYSKNAGDIDCSDIVQQQKFSVSFYLQRVLCEPEEVSYASRFSDHGAFASPNLSHQLDHPEEYIRYDENILKVLKYALNEYSLLDSAYTTSHTLFTSAIFSTLAGLKQAGQVKIKKPCTSTGEIPGSENGADEADTLCVIIDYDEVDEPKQEWVQKTLGDMDVEIYHGKPKVAIVKCTVPAEDLNQVVPGPDYLILTINYATADCKSKQIPDLNKFNSTAEFINQLRCVEGVENVSVNSSLHKRYLRETVGVERERLRPDAPSDRVVKSGDGGKALIICNQYEVKPWMDEKERSIVPFRQEVLKNAKVVFEDLLGLQVEVLCDLTAAEIKRSISNFSVSEGHGSLAVLAVFSHGYKRKISGADSDSECSVQEIIDCLQGGNIDSIPKLLFLSFCRGELPARYNRAPCSFESSPQFPWPENEIGMLLQPIRQQLTPAEHKREWRNMFPSLAVPVNYYICFTTLPDSKSSPGKFFKILLDYLIEISETKSGGGTSEMKCRDQQSADIKLLAAANTLEVDKSISTSTTCLPSSPEMELVNMLTDVAGILKEKSRSTQYANICYTVNKESKQILFNILSKSST